MTPGEMIAKGLDLSADGCKSALVFETEFIAGEKWKRRLRQAARRLGLSLSSATGART